MSGYTCEFCRHYLPNNSATGTCLYRPPPAVKALYDALYAEAGLRINYETLRQQHPTTSYGDTCGEFKVKIKG